MQIRKDLKELLGDDFNELETITTQGINRQVTQRDNEDDFKEYIEHIKKTRGEEAVQAVEHIRDLVMSHYQKYGENTTDINK